MMQTMIMSSSNLTNISFMKMNYPMLILMTINIQTLFATMMTGTLMDSFWAWYILLLMFLNGMMVLFIYITSIASNWMFKIKFNTIIHIMYMMITLSIILYNINKMMFTEMMKYTEW